MGQIDYKIPYKKLSEREFESRLSGQVFQNLVDEMKAYVGGNRTDV